MWLSEVIAGIHVKFKKSMHYIPLRTNTRLFYFSLLTLANHVNQGCLNCSDRKSLSVQHSGSGWFPLQYTIYKKMEEYSEYLHFVKYKQLDLVFSLFFSLCKATSNMWGRVWTDQKSFVGLVFFKSSHHHMDYHHVRLQSSCELVELQR